MALRDLNDDNNNLGRLLAEQETINDFSTGYEQATGGGGGAIEYTPYVDVTNAPVVDVVPRVIAPQVLQTLSLPQFDFSTGVASCDTCGHDEAASFASTSKVAATEATEPKVTPLPEGPKTINWLLILAAAGVGYMALKSKPTPGVGCLPDAPAPVQTEVPLGRPPRKKPEKLKHLDSFKIK